VPQLSDESASRLNVNAKVEVPKNAKRPSPFSWPIAAALVVAMMLMISGESWIALEKDKTSQLVRSNSQTVSQAEATHDRSAPPMVEPSTPMEPPSRAAAPDSIKAASGYLAAQLSAEDPDFEIYIVLPTRQVANSAQDH
jgi:hypothetical protein